MKFRFFLVLASFFTVFGLSSAASAIYIDCAVVGGACFGGTYDLEVISTGGDSYQATYTIDTSGSFSVLAEYLNDVEFKVANDYSVLSMTGPEGSLVDGPLNGAGCNGNNDTFICIDLAPKLESGMLSYTWIVAFESTGLIGEDEWHVGARYTSTDHQRGWVISESIPEPTAALLFGAGLLVAGHAGQRKRD